MISKYWFGITVALIVFTLIITINSPLSAIESDNDIKNPFDDYRKTKNNIAHEKVKQKSNVIERNKKNNNAEIILPFEWTGIIASEDNYLILLERGNQSYLIEKGESILGFTLLDITINKLTFEKDDKKAVLTMRSDEND